MLDGSEKLNEGSDNRLSAGNHNRPSLVGHFFQSQHHCNLPPSHRSTDIKRSYSPTTYSAVLEISRPFNGKIDNGTPYLTSITTCFEHISPLLYFTMER